MQQVAVRQVETTADGALVQLHLDGNHDAFAALYREYFHRLVRLCRARTGDLAAAEDLAQEALIRALAHLDRFEVNRPMWPWLKTIAIRLSIDYSRQRRPEPCEDPARGQSCTDETGWLEDGPILAEALAGLPARQRVALKLRYLDDWTPQEAAAALGLTRTAFDQLLFRARGKLRNEYRRVCGDTAGPLVVLLWPLLALLQRTRHAAWRARDAVQSLSLPTQVASETMAGVMVAATIGAATLGASLAPAPWSGGDALVGQMVTIPDEGAFAALAAASGFTTVTAERAPEEPALFPAVPAPHDSWRMAPPAPKAVEYPDLALRSAPKPAVVVVDAPDAPAAALADVPEAPGAPDAADAADPVAPSTVVALPQLPEAEPTLALPATAGDVASLDLPLGGVLSSLLQ